MSSPRVDWRPIAQELRAGRRIFVLTHANPDGDAVGSTIALARVLQELGGEVTIFVPTPVEARYDFLLEEDTRPVVFDPTIHEEALRGADTIVVLDTNQWSLLGRLAPALERAPGKKIVIDHHGGPAQLGDLAAIDPTASSTGELVFDLLNHLGAKIDAVTAQCLFAAMATDTGWFRFQRAGPPVFRAAADLLERGIQAYSIYKRIFERRTWSDLERLAELLATIEPRLGRRAAFVLMDRAAWDALSTGESAVVESLLDFGLSVEEVEVCALLREIAPGKVKISLRSKGNVDVRQVALQLGGGGHHNAAGAVVDAAGVELAASRLERTLASVLG